MERGADRGGRASATHSDAARGRAPRRGRRATTRSPTCSSPRAVHQTAIGNLDRAGRRGRGARPPGATGRAGGRRARRAPARPSRTACWSACATARPRRHGWPARGVRGTREPRLDRWLGACSGPPGTHRRREARASGASAARPDLGSVTAADLGLSPLALVLAAQPPAGDQPSELEARIAAFSRRGSPTPPRTTGSSSHDVHTRSGHVAGVGEPPRGRRRGRWRPPTSRSRETAGPAARRDGRPGRRSRRATAAVAAVRRAGTTLRRAATGHRGAASRRSARSPSSSASTPSSTVPAAPPEAAALLGEQVDRVRGAARRDSLPRIDEMLAANRRRPAPTRSTAQLELVRLALGAHQPRAPVFTLDAPARAQCRVRRRSRRACSTATSGPRSRGSTARPRPPRARSALWPADSTPRRTGADVVGHVGVAQLPHRPGARWCELPFGDEEPPPAGTVGLRRSSRPTGFDAGPAGRRPRRRRVGRGDPRRASTPPASRSTTTHPARDRRRRSCSPSTRSRTRDRWDLDDAARDGERDDRARPPAHAHAQGDRGLRRRCSLRCSCPTTTPRDVPSVSLKDLVDAAEARALLTCATTPAWSGRPERRVPDRDLGTCRSTELERRAGRSCRRSSPGRGSSPWRSRPTSLPGLQALVGDPLWLLARQWQFDELRGEDGGTPIAAVVEVEQARAVALPSRAPPTPIRRRRDRCRRRGASAWSRSSKPSR